MVCFLSKEQIVIACYLVETAARVGKNWRPCSPEFWKWGFLSVPEFPPVTFHAASPNPLCVWGEACGESSWVGTGSWHPPGGSWLLLCTRPQAAVSQSLSWGELATSPLPAAVEIKLSEKPQLRRANLCGFPGERASRHQTAGPLDFLGTENGLLSPAAFPRSLCMTGIYYSTNIGGSPGDLPLRIVWRKQGNALPQNFLKPLWPFPPP